MIQSDNLIGHSLGPYQIVEEIGRGGMGIVYKAWQPALQRYVAIKVLTSHLTDREVVQRFQYEARVAANLNHPNIVTIYDIAQQDNTLYIVMEYVDGRPLSEVIIREGPLPIERVVHLLRQIAGALDYAHRMHLIHRDIKPANILITSDDRAVITDFGIAKALEGSGATAQFTAAGTILGTPTYMSPEQIQGQPVDYRTDLYSLGVVCFEMLGGRPPFGGTTTAAILYAQVHTAPPSIRNLNAGVSKQVEMALTRMLSKLPESRFPTASAFVAALGGDFAIKPVTPQWTGETEVGVGRADFLDASMRGRKWTVPGKRRKLSPVLWLVIPIVAALLGVWFLVVEPAYMVRRLIAQGNEALQAGQYAIAEAAFATVLTKDEKNVDANLGLGEALRQQGRVAESLPHYQVAVAGNDRSSTAHIGLGWTYYGLGQYKQAIAEFTRTIALDPAQAEAYRGKGLSYYALGQYTEALEPLQTWVEMVPEANSVELNWTYFFTGQYDKALSGFTHLIQVEPDNIEGYKGQAQSHYALGQYHQAEEPLMKWIKMAPDDLEALRLLGWSYYHQERYAQAAGQFARASQLANADGEIFFGLGNSYSNLGEFEQAQTAFERWVELEPDKAEAHDALAWTLYELERYDEAIPVFDYALKLKETASSYHGLGASYYKLEEWERALAAFERWVELEPDKGTAYSSIGWSLNRLERYQEAVSAFKRALEANADGDIFFGLGNSYSNLGEFEQAQTAFERWVELEPDKAEAHDALAWTLYELERYDEAIPVFDYALKLKETASSYHGLGASYYKLEEWERALAAFERWVELEPDKGTAYSSIGWSLNKLHRYEEAVVAFSEALKLSKTASSYRGLGDSYHHLGEHDQALLAFQQWAKLEPGAAAAHNSVGWEYLLLRDCPNAIKSFEKALEIDPQLQAAQEGLARCKK